MFRTFLNIFRIPELRNKVLFTVGMLCIYRIGFYVPVPGVNQEKMTGGIGLGDLADYFAIFTGGDLNQSTIFGLGIMPYISASIIFQLLVTVVPALEKLQKEGEVGRKKIQEYTRYATVGLCLIQGTIWLNYLMRSQLVYAEFRGSVVYWLMALLTLTAGTVFLMWLGEQIDKYGIGNGISLIIMAGIVARMPAAMLWVWNNADLRVTSSDTDAMGPSKILFIVVAFVCVVAGSILITQGQRRIPIQQAKQMRGRRMYGGMKHYLPLQRSAGVRRSAAVPAATGESRWRDADHLRQLAADLSGHAVPATGVVFRRGSVAVFGGAVCHGGLLVRGDVHRDGLLFRVLLDHGAVPAEGDGQQPARLRQLHSRLAPGKAHRGLS